MWIYLSEAVDFQKEKSQDVVVNLVKGEERYLCSVSKQHEMLHFA